MKRFFKGVLFLFLVGLLTVAANVSLSAQVSIPEGSTVTSAVLSVYWHSYWGTTFNLHRIIADWNEGTVTWNSFAASFDPSVLAFFATTNGGSGWYTADLTSLVQAWLDNPSSNFGVVLRQVHPGVERWNLFYSSEYTDPTLGPKLEIWYVTANGTPGHVVIQQTDPAIASVYDASIYQLYPNAHYDLTDLVAATVPSDSTYIEKYSLIRFAFTVVPLSEGCTPGYWRNHYEDWPATGYHTGDYFNAVFGVNYFAADYTLAQAIWQGGGGLNVIARHGTAALLSAAHSEVNYPYTVAEVIAFVQSGDVSKLVAANELGCFIK